MRFPRCIEEPVGFTPVIILRDIKEKIVSKNIWKNEEHAKLFCVRKHIHQTISKDIISILTHHALRMKLETRYILSSHMKKWSLFSSCVSWIWDKRIIKSKPYFTSPSIHLCDRDFFLDALHRSFKSSYLIPESTCYSLMPQTDSENLLFFP